MQCNLWVRPQIEEVKAEQKKGASNGRTYKDHNNIPHPIENEHMISVIDLAEMREPPVICMVLILYTQKIGNRIVCLINQIHGMRLG